MTVRQIVGVTWLTLLAVLIVGGECSAASYAKGMLTDRENGFRVAVPGTWNRQFMTNQDSSTHLFVSPDQNVAVGITTYPGWNRKLGVLLNSFQGTVFGGSERVAQQQTDLNGVTGLLDVYRVQDPGGPIIVGAFARKGQGRAYVVWHMIPQRLYDSRHHEADAVMNTFSQAGSGSGQTPPQADHQPSPGAAAGQAGHTGASRGEALPAGRFSRFKDPVAGLQFDLPSGWSESHPEEHILSIRGTGDMELMTVNYQVLDRRNPKYGDLATASKDLYAQLPGLGRYTVINDDYTTIGDIPAHVVDVIVNPGDRDYAIRYIELERPEYIALMSLICPKDQHEAFAPIAKRVRLTIASF